MVDGYRPLLRDADEYPARYQLESVFSKLYRNPGKQKSPTGLLVLLKS